ncbi:META domain-containing protein [Litchfieldella xinjiangensis]|uniref:META domain-containing protein n=1 Tax=Litchfieldella xinjiangensis TaxID=1166948 RepID=UPI000B1F0032|nr:META domain-containing protein [Halomonas xinjiangensis]
MGRHAMHAMKRMGIVLSLVGLVLTGCAGSPTPETTRQDVPAQAAGSGSPVVGPRWRLILFGTDERWSGSEPAWFEVTPGNGAWRLTGSDGCNRFNGDVSFDDGNRIRIDNVSSTRRACSGADQAEQVTAMLEQAYRYLIDHNRLVFFGRDSRVLGGFQRS